MLFVANVILLKSRSCQERRDKHTAHGLENVACSSYIQPLPKTRGAALGSCFEVVMVVLGWGARVTVRFGKKITDEGEGRYVDTTKNSS